MRVRTIELRTRHLPAMKAVIHPPCEEHGDTLAELLLTDEPCRCDVLDIRDVEVARRLERMAREAAAHLEDAAKRHQIEEQAATAFRQAHGGLSLREMVTKAEEQLEANAYDRLLADICTSCEMCGERMSVDDTEAHHRFCSSCEFDIMRDRARQELATENEVKRRVEYDRCNADYRGEDLGSLIGDIS